MLEELARTAGTSRSVLAERLAQLVGQAPMQCMLFASNLLAHSNALLVRIAEEVGYQTDPTPSWPSVEHGQLIRACHRPRHPRPVGSGRDWPGLPRRNAS
jgi:hypothetical protein